MDALQTPQQCEDLGARMIAYLALANEYQATYQKSARKAKMKAFDELKDRYKEANQKMPPSIAKEFIDAYCADDSYAYDLAERTSRALVHCCDMLRSILSSKKSERQHSNYNP